MNTIPDFSGFCFYPLHNSGQICSGCGSNEQMDMVWHDTKIMQSEPVLFLCTLKDEEHYFLAQFLLKNTDFIISPRSYMISRPFNQFSLLSHSLPPKSTKKSDFHFF
jgi:hypothetical protein